jgi:hypothetical protein
LGCINVSAGDQGPVACHRGLSASLAVAAAFTASASSNPCWNFSKQSFAFRTLACMYGEPPLSLEFDSNICIAFCRTTAQRKHPCRHHGGPSGACTDGAWTRELAPPCNRLPWSSVWRMHGHGSPNCMVERPRSSHDPIETRCAFEEGRWRTRRRESCGPPPRPSPRSCAPSCRPWPACRRPWPRLGQARLTLGYGH